MRTVIMLLSIVLISLNGDSQTCIIAMRLKDGIMVATDTRRTTIITYISPTGEKTTKYIADTVCKVKKIGSLYISNAGLDIYSAYNLAVHAIRNNKTINEIAKSFLKKRKERIYFLIDSLKRDSSFEVGYNYIRDFQTIFYGFEKGFPKMVKVEIGLISKINEPTLLKDSIFYSQELPKSDNTFFLGEYEYAKSYFLNKISKNNVVEAMLTAIEFQNSKTPNHVGKPIEIFAITKNGIKWIIDPMNYESTFR